MVYPTFAMLLVAAALCFGVGRRASARLLGLGAAAISLLAALLVALSTPAAPDALPLVLLELGAAKFSLSLGLAAGERAIAIALLGGGGAVLLALAGAITLTVRGFGSIFAWSLLSMAAALLSLAAPPLSLAQPLAWAMVAISGYSALRASGATTSTAPPLGLTLGLLASGLLAGGLLATAQPLASGALPALPATLCGLAAALALAGSPPMAGARADANEAPAPLGALVYGLAAPATAFGWLLRALAVMPPLSQSWSMALGLLGAFGALACGAGALGERRLRPILAWATAGQTSLVVAAAALGGTLASVTGSGLLVGLMLTAAVGAGAVATLERTTGSDDYTVGNALPPRVTGALWAVAVAGSVGLPPLWGFWPRLWLLTEAQRQPWLLAPLLAGAVLLTLAMLVPLARLWGFNATTTPPRASWADVLPASLAGLPLLILGVAPGLAWTPWLQYVPGAPAESPVTSGVRLAAVGAGLTLVVLTALLGWAKPARTLVQDSDEVPVRLAPDALGAALRPVAWLANPTPLLRALWAGLQSMSKALRFLMSFFEQRYYLLGMLATLIMIMLLMAQ